MNAYNKMIGLTISFFFWFSMKKTLHNSIIDTTSKHNKFIQDVTKEFILVNEI